MRSCTRSKERLTAVKRSMEITCKLSAEKLTCFRHRRFSPYRTHCPRFSLFIALSVVPAVHQTRARFLAEQSGLCVCFRAPRRQIFS